MHIMSEPGPIIIVDYNPDWPLQFEEIKVDLEAALSNVQYISIQHVGSTSVPSLSAKPILDIDVIVKKEHVQTAIKAICSHSGYESKGEWGIPGRWALRNPSLLPVRNLYVCEDGCQALRNHLALRDTLRKNAELRDEYGRVKREIAATTANIEVYGEAKNDVVEKILKEAGFSDRDRNAIRDVNLVTHPRT